MSVKDRKTVQISTQLLIRSEEASQSDFFDQLYQVRKFRRWFNVLPMVWFTADQEYFELGCKGRIYFGFPFFFYNITCTKLVPNQLVELSISGWLDGKITISFVEQEHGILMDHLLDVAGKNLFVHLYYKQLLSVNHRFFMHWRYTVLRKRLRKNF